ncbi:hypothetical protein B0H13DRAFT_2366852 [Mycena leptocephala]|nr:hypothetical protein B0H13DRAFT_2366852 [Mycena leptocephala]
MCTPSAVPSARGERSPSVTSPLSLIHAVRPSSAEVRPHMFDTALLPSLMRRAALAHAAVVHDRPQHVLRPHAHHGHRLRHIRLNAWRAQPRIRGAPLPAGLAAAATVLYRRRCLHRLPARYGLSQRRPTPRSKRRHTTRSAHPRL